MKNLSGRILKLIKTKFVSDVFWNLISVAILALIGIIINIVIAKYYRVSGLGIYNQVFSIYVILSIISRVGIDVSIVKYIAEYNDDSIAIKNIISSALLIVTVVSLVIMCIAWMTSSLFATILNSQNISSAFKLICIGIPIASINKLFMGILIGLRRMKTYALLQSLRSLLILLFVLCFAFSTDDVQYVTLAFPLTEILLFFILIISLKEFLAFKTDRDFFWIKKHLSFGSKSFLSGSIGIISNKIDILMIGYFLSDKAVGIYSIAAELAKGLLNLSNVIGLNFFPIITRLWTEGKVSELQHYMKKVRRYTYVIFLPIIILSIIMYPMFIEYYFEEKEFLGSITPFNILLLGILIFSGFSAYGGLLNQTGYPGAQLKRILLTFLVNITANIIMIPVLGIIGAAIATSLSYLMSIFILNFYSKKILGFSIS